MDVSTSTNMGTVLPGKTVEAVAHRNIDGFPEYSILLFGVGNNLGVSATATDSSLVQFELLQSASILKTTGNPVSVLLIKQF
jgi:hypothetical protein